MIAKETAMPVYRLTSQAIEALPGTSFAERGVRERADLQRLLKANVAVVAPDVLVICEEFGEWEDSKRRIDLLGIDKNANLVVVELKRDDEGAHMELQAIRYAAMVSSMTFARAIEVYQTFLGKTAPGQDARMKLLEFLGWEEPGEFGRDVRIILVAADFSKELTTAVLWLNGRDLDIRCVRLKPYAMGGETIIDAQQLVPLPEAGDYTVRLREKAIEGREAARQGEDTGYWFMNTGDDGSNEGRSWEDCRKYGFMLAGGGRKWIDDVRKLKAGDKLFAYLSGHGYVGFGEVLAEAVPFKDFVPSEETKPLVDLPLTAKIRRERMSDPERCDWCASVRWIQDVDRDGGVLMHRARNGTLNRIRQSDLVAELLRHFGGNSDRA
jgi:hypothetical protein